MYVISTRVVTFIPAYLVAGKCEGLQIHNEHIALFRPNVQPFVLKKSTGYVKLLTIVLYVLVHLPETRL